jgi:hypothetical protein
MYVYDGFLCSKSNYKGKYQLHVKHLQTLQIAKTIMARLLRSQFDSLRQLPKSAGPNLTACDSFQNLSAACDSFQNLSQKPSWPHPLPQVIYLPVHVRSFFQLRHVTPF